MGRVGRVQLRVFLYLPQLIYDPSQNYPYKLSLNFRPAQPEANLDV